MKPFVEELEFYSRIYHRLSSDPEDPICYDYTTNDNPLFDQDTEDPEVLNILLKNPKDISVLDCVKAHRPSTRLRWRTSDIDKTRKPRNWVKKEIKRADGMVVEKFVRESDAFRGELRPKRVNAEVLSILAFNDAEYEAFLKEPGWSKEEYQYLIEMYKKYSTNWVLIADRYVFHNRRRSVYEIRQKFHFLFDSLCEARRKPDLASQYDWQSDLFNLRWFQHYYDRSKGQILNDFMLLRDCLIQLPDLEAIENQRPHIQPIHGSVPQTPTVPAAPVQKAQVSQRSSSSAPEGKLPVVQKTVKFAVESTVDYTKQIEPAKDTSALRFFSRTALGPHFRSQEIRLLSNVNQKKRNNIESVCDNLNITNHIYYTDDAIEHYTRLASGITAITELKNIFDTATSELVNLHREYCDKTGADEPLDLPKLPEAAEGQQVIWNKIDPNSSSLGSLLKRKLVSTS
ncbi:hypothetical protein FO519_005347 [Halicephalobus sp. NKZ332]|nr:hypothetical protein FO519_005347 [Halicephalobus sp. NKZ332]